MHIAIAIYDDKAFDINVLGLFKTETESSECLLKEAQDIARAHNISEPQSFMDDGFDSLRDIGWRFFESVVEAKEAWLDAREVYVVTSYAYEWADLNSVHVFQDMQGAQEFMEELVQSTLQKHGINFSDSWKLDLSEIGFDVNISAIYFRRE